MVKCSKSEIQRLKTALRWKIPTVQRERIQMVLLREGGLTQPEIAAAMGVSLSTVNRAHMAYDQGGTSTSTVRLAGSSAANPFACIATGIACLWGRAKEAELSMLGQIGKPERIPEYPSRQGQERSIPPDGLWPPGLQELRPARQDHADDLPQGASRNRRQ